VNEALPAKTTECSYGIYADDILKVYDGFDRPTAGCCSGIDPGLRDKIA
jgi:hypothetical protein